MMTRSHAFAMLILSTAAAAQAQTVPLQMNLAPGQVWKFDNLQDTEQKNQATFNGQTQPFGTKTHEHLVGTMEVVNVRNGAASELKITFDPASEISNEFNGQTNKIPFPYTTAVTLTRHDDGSVTDDFQGQVPQQASEELHSFMERDLVLMPQRGMSIGDEWSADPATAGRYLQLGQGGKGGVTIKLLDVKTVDGKQVAELKVSMAVLNAAGAMNVKAIAQGTELVDLASGHVIKGDLTGTIDLNGQQPGPGPGGQQVNYDVAGHGTMTIAATSSLVSGPASGSRKYVDVGKLLDTPSTPAAPAGPVTGGGGNPLDEAAPAPFAGSFSDGKLTVDLQPQNGSYAGTFSLGSQKFPATASAQGSSLSGSFTANNNPFKFTATLDGDTLTLVSGSTTYKLKKAALANPLDGK